MSDLAILVPVLNRPQNVGPLLASVQESTPDARVLFVTSPGDRAECAAIDAHGGERIESDGGYSVKINAGVATTDEAHVFLGADDLRFKPGWFEAARGVDEVVGVNDLIDRARSHATHFLVTREYCNLGQIDSQPGVLHEGYRHERCDDELIATASHRGVYAYAPDSHVEHLHPLVGKADNDATYDLGVSSREVDRLTFLSRRFLWT